MVVEAKVFRLGEIEEDLCKKVVELEAQVTPSTPLQVLEERRKEATEDAKKIEDVKALFAKAFDQVSQAWEYLINDKELEKITEQLRTVEIDVNQMKYEMKKLSLAKKMAKDAKMQKVHQQVVTLRTKKQK